MSFIKIAAAIATCFITAHCLADVVEFGQGDYQPIPYSENGLNFDIAPGTDSAYAGGSPNVLIVGTNDVPIHIVVSSEIPFDLQSINVDGFSRSWEIKSSSGATVDLVSTGVLDFSGLTGWSNISSFSIVHDPAEVNAYIRVESITFEPVPEPASLLPILGFAMLFRRRRS